MQVNPYVLLQPVAPENAWRPDIDPHDIFVGAQAGLVVNELVSVPDSELLVVDLETRGTDPNAPDSAIVGVGLAWRTGGELHAKYFDYQSMEDEARACLWEILGYAHGVVTAYNLLFDGAWIAREVSRLSQVDTDEGGGLPGARLAEPRWTHCSFALLRQLATEDFPGQRWGLKQAQIDLLSWFDTNEAGIERWLLENGYHRQGPRLQPDESPQQHMAAIRTWLQGGNGKKPRRCAADKGEMWRVPAPILGEYCLLDCISTLLLLEDVLLPVLSRFPELDEWHREYFPSIDRLLWEQSAYGICLAVERMEKHGEYLRRAQAVADRLLRESPIGLRVMQYETEHHTAAIEAHRLREPARYKKKKETKEPVQYTKKGALAQSWIKWDEKRRRAPEESKNWQKWEEKRRAILEDCASYSFNLGSDDQRRWLLFGDEVNPGPVAWRSTGKTRQKRKGQVTVEVPVFEVEGINGWVELEGTEAGLLPTSGDLYTQLEPAVARPLQLHADASQELGYVESYLGCARRAPDGTQRIHPGWVSPGTKTLRLAGREPNFQQAPKTRQFLECLIADAECEWVEGDWSALEPHVLTELSQDPALLRLYGPDAPKHDVYLYSGAHYAVVGEEVRKYYDVDAPDLPKAKKALKQVRDKVLKTTYLGKSYGAGWKKLLSKYRLEGYPLTEAEAQQISESHDEMYRVSGRDFHAILEAEWRARGGWVLTGLGLPNPVYEGKKKDLINRVVQRTGHDIHTIFVVRLARRLAAEGIEARGIIWDFHDQFIFSVRKGQGARALEIIREEVAALNALLGSTVPLKLEPKLCTDMAVAKEAEFDWTQAYPEVI